LLALETGAKRRAYLRVTEREAKVERALWDDALAREEHGISHLAEGEAKRKGRRREHGGAAERPAERMRKRAVRHGLRRRKVERAAVLIAEKPTRIRSAR
jgi:hypothetical protein